MPDLYSIIRRNSWLFAPMVFLFILPFTHTVALRMTALAVTLGYALWLWRRAGVPALPARKSWAAFAVIAAASIYWSVDPGYSFGEVKNEVGYAFAAYFSFFLLASCRRTEGYFSRALVVGAAVSTSLALAAFFVLGRWYNLGFHGGENDFSTYVIFMVPVLLFAFATADSALEKGLLVLLGVALLVGGVLTDQRAFWFALAVQLLTLGLYGVWRLQWPKGIRVALVGLLVVGAVLISPIGVYKENNVGFLDIGAAIAKIKQDPRPKRIWRNSVAAIKERPVLGAGFGRRIFLKAYPQFVKAQGWHGHNLLLNKAIQLGFVGLAAFLVLFGTVAWCFSRYLKSNDRRAALAGLCGLLLMVGFLAINLANDSFMRHNALLFWSAVGLWLGYAARVSSRSKTQGVAPVGNAPPAG